MSKRLNAGFTLIELMVVVVIIGLLAAVAVPMYTRYMKKAKTSEARTLVRKIYDGARAYYLDCPTSPAMFPEPSQPATPTLGTCCANGGRCSPGQDYWTNPTWVALAFSVDDPHYYMYAYTVAGNPAKGSPAVVDGSNNYTALGYGDLDCDGQYSTFSVFGAIDKKHADGPAGSAVVGSSNTLE